MVRFIDDTLNAPGFRCQECQSEERATGAGFVAAIQLHLAECMEAGHHVTYWGFRPEAR